ncbi:MAG: hypothetical protein G5Z42_05485 [Caldisphaeraceae archaeon]|nr:hypothetical protein [Caldisphaeraceae archaeon]MEB3692326.1 hypothetical protein [Caldisphaeraceae archaeon]MEB3798251.1 hypothetical protein [Caldisphaeraceae archaeon]
MPKERKSSRQREEKREESVFEISRGLLARVKKDVERVSYITPYKASVSYGIPISVARRLLKELEGEGLLTLYSRSKRNPIYVPRSNQ